MINKNLSKTLMPFFAAAVLAAFSACGDDSSSSGPSDNGSAESDLVVDSYDALPVCSDKREGVTAYVKDKKIAYICVDGDWTPDSNPGNDLKSSSSSSVKGASSSSVVSGGKKKSSSSSAGKKVSSSSSDGFNWNVSKERYLNPEIVYDSIWDGRSQYYRTLKIGDQVWMAENLNRFDTTIAGQCWCYGDKISSSTRNCFVTGQLYTWAAAVGKSEEECGYNGKDCDLGDGKIQGICPEGWHLPNNDEWETLFTNVGGKENAGKVLKSRTGWTGSGNGTDSVGFCVLPAGNRNDRGGFNDDVAYFWSATIYHNELSGAEYSNHYGYVVDVYNEVDSVEISPVEKNNAFSVRCVKD